MQARPSKGANLSWLRHDLNLSNPCDQFATHRPNIWSENRIGWWYRCDLPADRCTRHWFLQRLLAMRNPTRTHQKFENYLRRYDFSGQYNKFLNWGRYSIRECDIGLWVSVSIRRLRFHQERAQQRSCLEEGRDLHCEKRPAESRTGTIRKTTKPKGEESAHEALPMHGGGAKNIYIFILPRTLPGSAWCMELRPISQAEHDRFRTEAAVIPCTRYGIAARLAGGESVPTERAG